MEAFEYVMVLVSIIIGLAITHVLAALGTAVHRIRGHGPPIRLGATYLLWVGFTFIWLVSFWWWEFKFQELELQWTFGLYLFVVGYAIWLFLMSVILVPSRLEGVENSFDYLMEMRRWFFGALLVATAIDTIDSFLKGNAWALRPELIAQTGVITAAAIVGMVTIRPRLQLAGAIAAFVTQLVYMFNEVGILGSW
ncbi:MAG TPA: hypothetical protein VLA33_05765 [Gemmatimonadota bacterium]|nr:hypothetical protein [Gemmatimonadota bacterium]